MRVLVHQSLTQHAPSDAAFRLRDGDTRTVKKTARVAGTLGLLGLLGTVVLAGCGSSGGGSSDASSTATATATVTVTTTAPASTAASSAATSSSATTARCTIADLKVSLGPPEGAAGSTFVPVRLTNTSQQPCRTGGFGGASLVISPRSEPVGAPADRTDQASAKPLVLQPGGRAVATLQVTQAGNYAASTCQPVPTKGLRIYPPNETQAAYVAFDATACQSGRVHLLHLKPYQAG